MRVILLHWKNQPGNRVEVFSNLKLLCAHYPRYNYNTLNNYLSKSRKAYENEEVRIERMVVNRRPPQTIPGREMVLTAERVKMRSHNEESQNKAYWITRTPSERLRAATKLSMQMLKKGQRMDRSRVVKRKIRQ